MAIRAVVYLLILSVAWTSAEAQQSDLPNGTSLSASEYDALLGLLVNDTTELISLYRTSVHGTEYGNLLDRVGNALPLVLVIKKDEYVFGYYIGGGLLQPDDHTRKFTDVNKTGTLNYMCDVWRFSLAGHFPTPTKMDLDSNETFVTVAVRGADVCCENVNIGAALHLGWGGSGGSHQPAADIRSCYHEAIVSDDLPEGYIGERDEDGDALFGGSLEFMGDEIEVLRASASRTQIAIAVLVGLTAVVFAAF
ncbi:unnamed protein product [Vitrella brassicaformis CCMP3155]|uniref:TLDc domain-containing protein n=1 Tax=Vitrella brassicaformis (strain CCMP3155) TaxID=1169540 RepID=A0A0G4GTK4_VITBC|nr:unnamed protein product [Vitrella brassicaformis CCMP3155]|eukprot:CEM34104.1 unnamed protein product [Vitrella brassicaformis CCMP3155]